MIWLASFPRSGNTFFRNILHDVYGIESTVFKLAHTNSKVVKTHKLPFELIPSDPKIPAVYIVRDGRDVVVSMAYQRTDLTERGSDLKKNMISIITDSRKENFGGWSRNVEEWLKRASLIIRFEELIKEPIANVNKLGGMLKLPKPDLSKLPTFESQKKGNAHYSPIEKHSDLSHNTVNDLFFRSGKVGGWKEEMSDEVHQMFWDKHGKTTEKVGYSFSGEIIPRKLDNLLTHSAEESLSLRVNAKWDKVINQLKNKIK